MPFPITNTTTPSPDSSSPDGLLALGLTSGGIAVVLFWFTASRGNRLLLHYLNERQFYSMAAAEPAGGNNVGPGVNVGDTSMMSTSTKKSSASSGLHPVWYADCRLMFYSLTIISGVTYTICTLVLLMSPPHSQMRKNSIDGDILSLTNVCAYLSMVSIVIWTILHGIMLEWRREQLNKISFQKQQNINNNQQLGANGFVNNASSSHLSHQNHPNRHSNSALLMTTQANLSNNNYNNSTSGLSNNNSNNVRSSNQILPPGVPSVLMSKQGSSQNLAFGENQQQKSNSKLSYHQQSNSNLQQHQQQQYQQSQQRQSSVEESHPTMSGDVAKDDEDEDDRSSRNQSYVEHEGDEDEDEYNKYFQGYGSTDDIGEAAKQNQFGRAVAAAQGNNIPPGGGSPQIQVFNNGVPQNTSSNFVNPASRGYLQSSFANNNNQNDSSNRSSVHNNNNHHHNQNNNTTDCTTILPNASHNLSTARSQKSQRPNKPFLWRVLEFLYPLRLLLSIVLTIFYYAVVTVLTESKLINGENFSAGISGVLAIICGVLSAGGTYYLGRSVKAAKRFGLALAILCVFLMLRCVVVIGPVQRAMDRDATPMILPLIDAMSITAVIVVLPSRQFCLCFSTSVEDE